MSEVKRIIEEEFGFKTQEDFKTYHKAITDGTREVTEEEFERLNPDKIDAGEFWEYLEDNFDRAVCGEISTNRGPLEHTSNKAKDNKYGLNCPIRGFRLFDFSTIFDSAKRF